MNFIYKLAEIFFINHIKIPEKREYYAYLIYGFVHHPIRAIRRYFFYKKASRKVKMAIDDYLESLEDNAPILRLPEESDEQLRTRLKKSLSCFVGKKFPG